MLHPSFDPEIERKTMENLKGAGDLAEAWIKEHPYETLEIGSNVASLVLMGPGAGAAKNVAQKSLVKGVNRVKNFFGLGNSVEKLTTPPTGNIIEGLNPSEPKPQQIVPQKKSVVFRDNPTNTNVANKALIPGKQGLNPLPVLKNEQSVGIAVPGLKNSSKKQTEF